MRTFAGGLFYATVTWSWEARATGVTHQTCWPDWARTRRSSLRRDDESSSVSFVKPTALRSRQRDPRAHRSQSAAAGHNIAVGQAQIDFWAQFGGNPRHGVWVIGDRARAPEGFEADTSWLGSGSYPYVTAIDTDAFARVLPTMITNYRDYLLFLDMAKVLGTIVEEPTMPGFPNADERRAARRYYAMTNAPDRDNHVRHDVTDIIVPLGARLLGTLDESMRQSLTALPEAQRRNIFRLKKGSETPLFRSARRTAHPIRPTNEHPERGRL
jgi:hypothetical protein